MDKETLMRHLDGVQSTINGVREHHIEMLIQEFERAERLEAAARELYEYYGHLADVVLGPELRAVLAPTPEGSDGEWTDEELRHVELLRQAGCKCQRPLLGYKPSVGPRCRLCNTQALDPASGEEER